MIENAKHIREEKHNLARGTVFLLVSQTSFIFFSYILHIGLGRLLTIADYGNFGIVLSTLSIFLLFVNSGVPEAVSKYVSENPLNAIPIRNKALKIQLLLSLVLFVVFFFSAPKIASIFRDKSLINLFRITSVVIPVSSVVALYYHFLNGLKAFTEQATINILRAAIRVTLVLILVYAGFGLNGAVVGFSATSLIILMLTMLIFKYKIKLPRPRTIINYPAEKIIGFAAPSLIFSGAITLLLTMDLLFIKSLLSDPNQSGFYTSATMIAKIPYYLFLAIPLAIFPVVSESVKKRRIDLTQSYIKNSLHFLILILTPTCFLISSNAKSLISLFYTSGYIAAAHPLQILVFGIMFLSIFSIFGAIIKASGKPTIAMAIAISAIPINAVLNLIFIPQYGIAGAALASSISMLLCMLFSASYVFYKFGSFLSLVSLFKIVLTSVVVSTFMRILSPAGLFIIPLYIISFTLYLLLLFFIGGINIHHLSKFKTLIRVNY